MGSLHPCWRFDQLVHLPGSLWNVVDGGSFQIFGSSPDHRGGRKSSFDADYRRNVSESEYCCDSAGLVTACCLNYFFEQLFGGGVIS